MRPCSPQAGPPADIGIRGRAPPRAILCPQRVCSSTPPFSILHANVLSALYSHRFSPLSHHDPFAHRYIPPPPSPPTPRTSLDVASRQAAPARGAAAFFGGLIASAAAAPPPLRPLQASATRPAGSEGGEPALRGGASSPSAAQFDAWCGLPGSCLPPARPFLGRRASSVPPPLFDSGSPSPSPRREQVPARDSSPLGRGGGPGLYGGPPAAPSGASSSMASEARVWPPPPQPRSRSRSPTEGRAFPGATASFNVPPSGGAEGQARQTRRGPLYCSAFLILFPSSPACLFRPSLLFRIQRAAPRANASDSQLLRGLATGRGGPASPSASARWTSG